MPKILMLGDTHGNDKFFARACKAAVELGCDRILQLGDFGYWEHYNEGVGYLKWCNRQLAEKNLECFWLDGNHENHPLLWLNYGPGGERHKPTKEGFWEIRAYLYYLPRGHRWTWDGVSFLALGGAYSVDKEYRTPNRSWWHTEMITEVEAEKASAGGNVDVLVSHDCPWGVEIPSMRAYEKNVFPESQFNRETLLEVVKAVQPEVLFHGHYHDRYSANVTIPVGADEHGLQWHEFEVHGLGADMSPYGAAWMVFDTEAFRARHTV